MLTILLALAQAAAAGYVLYICLMVLRVMTRSTHFLMRMAYWMLAGGAFMAVLAAVQIEVTGATLVLCCAVATLLTVTRRKPRHAA